LGDGEKYWYAGRTFFLTDLNYLDKILKCSNDPEVMELVASMPGVLACDGRLDTLMNDILEELAGMKD